MNTTYDSNRVQAALRNGEQCVLVVQPRTDLRPGAVAALLLPALVLAGVPIAGSVAAGWSALLTGLPFLACAAVLLFSLLRERWRLARTLYLLTERRAIILAPSGLRGQRVVSFPLHAELVVQVQKHGYGHGGNIYGDIIFAWERRWQPGVRVCRLLQPVGFLAVPQVERVAQLIAEQVAAMPAGEAQPPVEGVVPLLPDRKGRLRVFRFEHLSAMWVGAGGCAVAFVLYLAGVCQLPQEQRFGRNCEMTTATVLSQRRVVSRWNTNRHAEKESEWKNPHTRRIHYALYYPTLQFADAEGHLYTVECTAPQPRFQFTPGSKVQVCYDRADPRRMVPGTPSRRGLTCCLLSDLAVLIGACLIAAGLLPKKPA